MDVWEDPLVAALAGDHALGVIVAQWQRRQAAAVPPRYAAPPAQVRLRLHLRTGVALLSVRSAE